MFKPSQHATFIMVYNMLYYMFKKFAPTEILHFLWFIFHKKSAT